MRRLVSQLHKSDEILVHTSGRPNARPYVIADVIPEEGNKVTLVLTGQGDQLKLHVHLTDRFKLA